MCSTFSVAQSRSEKRKETNKNKRFLKVKRLFKLICVLLVLQLAGFALIIGAGQYMIDEKIIHQLQHPGSDKGTNTQIREYISINDMPDYVWKSFIAIEDHRFMSH